MEKVVAGWKQGQTQTRRRRQKKDGDEGNLMSFRSERRSSEMGLIRRGTGEEYAWLRSDRPGFHVIIVH